MTMLTNEEATPKAPEKLYDNHCGAADAPRHVHLEIEVGPTSALIHSRLRESVGTGQNRAVTFRANNPCSVKFDDEVVFGMAEQSLQAGKIEVLGIDDDVHGRSTECAILPDNTWKMRIPQQTPPRIDVP